MSPSRYALAFVGLCALIVSLGHADAQKPHIASPDPLSGQAMADMAASIRRQFSPCFDRIAKPGPGAERIVLTVRLRYNRDGSLAAAPEMVGEPAGVDDSNRRYVGAVVDGANTAFRDCSPLRGLPPELYDGPNGWSNFSLRYKLPG